MAGQRLTDKTALAQQTGSGDLFMVVDVNDTTGSAAGTSKKIDSKFVIQTDKISVSNAELVALDDGGGAGESKTIVSAPGSGYIIVPLQTTTYLSGASAGTGSNPATIDNLPLLIWTNGTLNGGWSCDIYITYQIVKLS